MSKRILLKKTKTIVKSSNPPLENIFIDCNGVTVKGSPESRKIIKQKNFVNQSLYTIGQQLDCIEDKISHTSIQIEKPLISLYEKRKSLGLKTNSQKNIAKIEKNAF